MNAFIQKIALVFVALCGVVTSGCGPGDVDKGPIRLTLQMRFKGSCGQIPTGYKAQCMSAIQLLTLQDGREVQRLCLNDFDTLDDLSELNTLVDLKTATLETRGEVRFAVRGLHSQNGNDDPCSDPRIGDRLFWGESDEIDLREITEDQVIDVRIDCRACTGGCDTLGEETCPNLLPESYCVPFQLGLSCERGCDDNSECFEGNLKCGADGRCLPEEGDPFGNEGGFCFPCSSSLDCDDGRVCVAQPGERTGLCTESCPFNRCVQGATCQPLGSNLVLLGAPE